MANRQLKHPRKITEEEWEEVVRGCVVMLRSLGLAGWYVLEDMNWDATRRGDGLSVAAGVAREWYGLPKDPCEFWGVTEEEMKSYPMPGRTEEPEWMRAGLTQYLTHLADRSQMSELVRFSKVRPDLVSCLGHEFWARMSRAGDLCVSSYLRYGGVVDCVPESVWAEYRAWVDSPRGNIWRKAESLAKLSWSRPDLVSTVPSEFWTGMDSTGTLVVSRYILEGGSATCIPEMVWREYVSWLGSEHGALRWKVVGLADVSRARPDVVASVPETWWTREDHNGTPVVARYLGWNGAAATLPQSVWPAYLAWLLSAHGDSWMKACGLAHLSRECPHVVELVPETWWTGKNRNGEPAVSVYLREGGVAGVVPESVWPEYLSWAGSRHVKRWRKAESLATLSRQRPDIVLRLPPGILASVVRTEDYRNKSGLSCAEMEGLVAERVASLPISPRESVWRSVVCG